MVNDGANIATQGQVAESTAPSPAPVTTTEAATPSVQPAQESTPSTVSAPEAVEEKVLKQSEVNKIVAREKKDAAEKARRDALLEIEQRSLENVRSQQDQVNSGQVQGDAPLTRNDLIRMEQDRAKKAQESFVNEVHGTFKQKIDSFKNEDPNFAKEVLANLPGDFIYNIAAVNGLNSLDNAKDVMAEMANHPSKYADINIACKENPQWGLTQLYKLSASIKANKEAKKQPVAPAPLEQIKPSPTGKDSGKLRPHDLMKLPQYRV